MSKRNTHETVEGWFQDLLASTRPLFEEIGYRLPEKIQIDFGFTSHGKRKGPRGEFWDKEASSNKIPKMIIRCDSAEIGRILDSFTHQCVHGAVGAAAGHDKPFRDCALRLGMEGKMREAVPGKRLGERLHALAEEIGPFPGGALDFEKRGYDGEEKKPRVVADVEEKQKSRQLKAECLIDDCGYIARVSAMNLRRGAPICPVHNEPMWHEPLPGEEQKPEAPEPEPEPAPPPGESTKRAWHVVLGVDPDAGLEECERAYRTRAKAAHVDNGGSHDAMVELNIAIEEARKEKGKFDGSAASDLTVSEEQ